jgi:hypothetical protein
MVFSALEQVNKFRPFTETLYSSWLDSEVSLYY